MKEWDRKNSESVQIQGVLQRAASFDIFCHRRIGTFSQKI